MQRRGSHREFFQGRVVVPAGVEDGARVQISGKSQHARIRVMPSKIFTRDGATITSVLKLTVAQATEGGFFDAETLHGAEPVFVEGGAKTGDTKTLERKGLPKGKGDGRGNHVVRLEVARAPTPEPEPEPESKPKREETAAGEAGRASKGDGEGEAPPAKRAKTEGGPPPTEVDLAALLAEKKRKLLAALEAKTGGT